jgi:hypothetical protein
VTTKPINWGAGTPGPWRGHWSKYQEGHFLVQAGAPSNRVLADFDGDGDGPDEQSMADARAIAKVPEMIMALRRMIPPNACLTNRNIRDSQILPMDVEVGELRAIVALLSEIDREGGR